MMRIFQNGVLVDQYNTEDRPEPRPEVLRLGQGVINWVNGFGDFPNEEEIRAALGNVEGGPVQKEVKV